MIDLEYSRTAMLRDIQATDEPAIEAESLPDPEEFAGRPHARFLVRGVTPADLLPGLDALFARRFHDVVPEDLHRNLLSPLKKAVGNAHKRGNRLAPDKWIRVGVVVTPGGVFIEVRDEGEGFDYRATLERFRGGDAYFTHSGSGFRRYSKARSIVSFADGGRSVLIRYLRAAGGGS